MKERDYLWDNIKALLIFLVVTGHCLEFCGFTLSAARFLDYFIYSFHMPAFIFVSGFWAKRYCREGRVRGEKALTLFLYYAVFQALFMGVRLILNINPSNLSFMRPCRGMWYLLAIFIYYLLVPVAEKLHPAAVISGSVVLSLIVGFDGDAGNYMALSRLFVFMPYFFIGYFLSSENVRKLRGIKTIVRIPVGLACAVCSAAIWIIQRNVFSRYIFFENKGYGKLGLSAFDGVLLRSECIAIALLMIAALILLMPSKKLFFSVVGQRSLQIFVWHMLLVILIFDTGLLNARVDTYLQLALTIAAAAAVTALLTPGFLGYPFKLIGKLASKRSK